MGRRPEGRAEQLQRERYGIDDEARAFKTCAGDPVLFSRRLRGEPVTWQALARRLARDEKHYQEIMTGVPAEHLVTFLDFLAAERKWNA